MQESMQDNEEKKNQKMTLKKSENPGNAVVQL